MSNAKEVRLPWGTFAKAADQLGITRQAVYQGWKANTPHIVAAVVAQVETAVKDRHRKLRAKEMAFELAAQYWQAKQDERFGPEYENFTE